jgi:hypothetical protein
MIHAPMQPVWRPAGHTTEQYVDAFRNEWITTANAVFSYRRVAAPSRVDAPPITGVDLQSLRKSRSSKLWCRRKHHCPSMLFGSLALIAAKTRRPKCRLKEYLGADLHNAWVPCRGHESECASIRGVTCIDEPVGIRELSVIEEVECFEAQL